MSRPMCHISKKQRQGLMALSVVALIFAILAWYYVTQHGRMAVQHVGPIKFYPETHELYIVNKTHDVVFKAWLGNPLPHPIYPLDCTRQFQTSNSLCINWVDMETPSKVDKEYARMEVTVKPPEANLHCITVEWTSFMLDFAPMDCISLTDAHWFGGASLYRQLWPLDDTSIPMQPYLMKDILVESDRHDVWGSVLENYWLSSKGVAVLVDEDVPLHVSFNQDFSQTLCLKSEYLDSPYQNQQVKYPHLKYTVCYSEDIKSVHQQVYNRWFPKPQGIPDERMIKSPIWSTWARYKTFVNETQVLDFADEILQHNLSNSQIEIDDKYTTSYGAYDFNQTKFPDAAGMIRKLKKKGFRVTSWFHPFTNLESPNFREGINHGYWVRDVSNSVPALVKWWQGEGALLDVTDNRSRQWYLNNLQSMRSDYGLDSFKFDAGEADFFPVHYNVTSQEFWNPNEYCTQYAQLVSELGGMIEVRCGHQTQNLPIFVRMFDKESSWSHDNGLRTMIPSALTQGILGYPFILPDMIGGNAYGGDGVFDSTNLKDLPERELFIRWMELTAYLPAMQFSIAPWQYSDADADDGVSIVDLSREMIRIHEEEVTPLIVRYAQEALSEGYPIIRPLWWLDPKHEDALTCDSEFLIGDAVLVAPILEPHSRSRDIFLPKGRWRDTLRRDRIIEGPRWLRDYPIQLDEIATFYNVEDK
ncbi:myogenesis-regulating glycosidase [Strongylocentrotus purpuratus]|uniref:Uncharacterized protein n=1 Tax=Strongylocentrotus purpuratus TaxID=7668 RepID=A0A7M7RAJ0_STRPU|nr:myogenesis-regulating glycosidase [Strongylocentrotus purpuratus]XP_781901.2 myogenesis-regulating glycosidase [Strongylocentrotus purpuratus]